MPHKFYPGVPSSDAIALLQSTKMDSPSGADVGSIPKLTGTGVVWGLLTKADIGLSQVSNTADVDKPISDQTLTALNLKQDKIQDGAVVSTGATAGTVIGFTTDKIGFFGATPSSRQSADLDLGSALSNLGLRSPGSAYGIITSGDVTLMGRTLVHQLQRRGISITANYAVAANDHFILVNAADGPKTVTLPAVVAADNTRDIVVKKTDATANAVTIVGTIDGTLNMTLTKTNQSITLKSYNNAWYTDRQTVASDFSSKENTIVAGTTAQYWRGDKTFQILDKNAVGLGSVQNISPADMPISNATQAALNNKADAVAGGAKLVVYNTYADAPALPVGTVVVSLTGV